MSHMFDNITDSISSIIPEEKISYRPEHQVAIGLAGAAIPSIAIRLMGKNLKTMLPVALAGFAAGSLALPAANQIIQYQIDNDRASVRDAIQKHFAPGMSADLSGNFVKQAGFFSKVLGTAGKAAWGTTTAIAKGLLPTSKKAPLGEKILGVAVKGTAIGGAGYGAYKATDYIARNREPESHTNLLRNNIIAGKIKPQELSSSEATPVRQMGMYGY